MLLLLLLLLVLGKSLEIRNVAEQTRSTKYLIILVLAYLFGFAICRKEEQKLGMLISIKKKNYNRYIPVISLISVVTHSHFLLLLKMKT